MTKINEYYPEDYLNYLIDLYDQWIEKEEKRGISYGEIVYLQNLLPNKKQEIEKELLEVLNYE